MNWYRSFVYTLLLITLSLGGANLSFGASSTPPEVFLANVDADGDGIATIGDRFVV